MVQTLVMTQKRPKSTFVKNMIALRKKRDWTAMKLAEEAGVSYPAVRDIEAGISEGRPATKEAIAKALDTTVDILNRSGSDVPLGILELAEAITKLKRENEVLLNLAEGLRQNSKSFLPVELTQKLSETVPLEVLRLLAIKYPEVAGLINGLLGIKPNKAKTKSKTTPS